MPVETVVARNTLDGVLVIGPNFEMAASIQWEAADDPTGGDVQFVSEAVANSPAFKKAVAKGLLVLEEDESDVKVVAALKKQIAGYRKREEQAAANDARANEAPVPDGAEKEPCVGPNASGMGKCGTPVAVAKTKGTNKSDGPTLCRPHRHLKSEYVPFEKDNKNAEGDEPPTKTVWVRVKVDKRG